MVAYKYKNEEIIKLLYYLCLLFFPLSMFSQSAVTRVVVDDQNLPISSVNVFIDNSQEELLQILMLTIVIIMQN